MKKSIVPDFKQKWELFFPKCSYPIVCYYSDELNGAEFIDKPEQNKKGYTCIFSQISRVRNGPSIALNMENLGCSGCYQALGFDVSLTEEKKRYICESEKIKSGFKKLESMFDQYPPQVNPGKYLIFKRWDMLNEFDNPEIVIFFGTPDMIAGIHGLVNFDSDDSNAVISPFGSGCNLIIGIPRLETEKENPKAVLGGLDPSVRLWLKRDYLTMSLPWSIFLRMMGNMSDSFLTTGNWKKLVRRF